MTQQQLDHARRAEKFHRRAQKAEGELHKLRHALREAKKHADKSYGQHTNGNWHYMFSRMLHHIARLKR